MLADPSNPVSLFGRKSLTPRLVPIVLIVVGAIFAGDLFIPLGYSIWVLYLAAVGIAILGSRPTLPLVTAAVASVLVLMGYLIKPVSAMDPVMALVNRLSGVLILWIVATLGRHFVKSKVEMSRRSWIQTSNARVQEAMQGGQEIGGLGRNVLSAICRSIDVPVAALHVIDGRDGLHRVAALGIADASAAPASHRLGEGLVGRVAVERRLLRVTSVAPDYLPLVTGVGSMQPRELVLLPMATDEGITGVLELACLHPLEDDALELLELVGGQVASELRASLYRMRQQELLAETQRQAEELQAQQEELQSANEELAAHAQALRESQERLTAQHAELEQANAQLEEQTQALEAQRDEVARARQELERKAAELERTNRYKSQFLANMSHELRTPLNSSLILSRLLADNREGTLTPEQMKYAETIHAAGNDLLQLINDVLDLAKVEAGKLDLRLGDVQVAGLLRDLRTTFEPMARERGLDLRIDVVDDDLRVVTDRLRVEQVLRNLLSNALKFTERGYVQLRVARTADGQIAFAVQDTGIGIAPDKQQLVFEAFQQADGTTSRKYGGTGLGLAISRDLAVRLGGELRLESEPGRGSTFTLVLPLELTAAAPREQMPASIARGTPSLRTAATAPAAGALGDDRENPREGRAVLVIEDDVAFAKVLQDLAIEMRFDALVATTADEGIRLAREHGPSAILLDIALPDHSGLAVLDRLKRDPTTRHIPVHVVSATDYTEEALAMGAIGYALKPVKREELVEAFRRLEEQLAERLRRVLVVEDDSRQSEAIRRLLGSAGVETVISVGVADALAVLREREIDCVVMDLSLADGTGFDLLERMMEEDGASPPVIVYTGKELSAEEEARLRRYSSSIIIKGARSPERLLDEVTLFLHQVEARLPPELQRMLSEARHREAHFEGRRILVVEDDIRNVFALSSILEPRGANVEIARNGLEALAALEKNEAIDLVLMDVMMPEMDGLQAMEEIRKRPNLARLPIIALTAKAMPDDQAKCLAAGANDYASKPIDVEKLLSLIRVWMPRRERV